MRVEKLGMANHLLGGLIRCIAISWGVGLIVSISVMSLVLFSSKVQADVGDAMALSQVQRLSDLKTGQLVFKSSQDHFLVSPTVDTDVEISVSGLLARVIVRQTFANPTSQWQEGIYVFPLPETAAVDHLRMKVGERIIEGEIKPRKAARQIYQQAKSAGKRASLVEQQRPNMFTSSVANIAPNDSITVVIEYQQMVTQQKDEFSLRFPLGMTPRYIPGHAIVNTKEISHFNGSGWAVNTDQVIDASHITPPVLVTDSTTMPRANISVNLSAGFALKDVTSRYHEVDDVAVNQNTHQIRLIDYVPANRDFELVWHAAEQHAPQAALFKQHKDNENYAMLMLTPPKSLNVASILRELIFIIDTSGSMDGTSIKQAKRALQYGLTQLRPKDSFNIIRFSDDVDSVFPQAKLASRENLDIAHHYVDWLRADGGTEMAPALKLALQADHITTGLRQVVFLTDGSVGNEDALFSLIKQNLGSSRLFTVGIGSAPNSHFMRRAARYGRGSHSYIGSGSEVREKMQVLFTKLAHPVLANIKVEFPNNVNVEMAPDTIPDLYLGEPLLLTFKAATELPDEITISGLLGESPWQQTVKLDGGAQSDAISVLWARRKIDSLMDQYRQNSGDDTIKQAIVDVALKHHLVSKFTSLVAVDKTPVRPLESPLNTKAVAVNPPAGSTGRQFPQTATPASLQLILGFILMLFGLALRRRGV
jgi:Ca-activated chloride channel family protein